MNNVACMGGWCRVREACGRYQITSYRRYQPPAERLCTKGLTEMWIPIQKIEDPVSRTLEGALIAMFGEEETA